MAWLQCIDYCIKKVFCNGIDQKTIKSAKASTAARQRGNILYVSHNSNSDNKKLHLEILSHYSESVALAEDGSKELALAYSNRSALLLHLCKYQECLVDIERAHQITKSEEMRVKLQTRKMKCMKLMNDKNNLLLEGEELETIESYAVGERSKTIPCAYDCVTLAYNEKYGRHVVATKDIEPGQVVAIEKGSVLFPNSNKIYLNCSHCLMFACNGIPCTSCAVVIYCSEKCRDEAWLQYHDIECAVLPVVMWVNNKLNLISLTIAVRLFIISVKREGLLTVVKVANEIYDLQRKGECVQGFFHNGLFQSNKFKTIFNLISCNKARGGEIEKSYLIQCMEEIVDLLAKFTGIFDSIDPKYLDKVKTFLSHEMLYKLKHISDFNGYQFEGRKCKCLSMEECITTCRDVDIGVIVLSFCSLLNHSCSYNVERMVTKNQQMILYAVRPIEKGEQLFITYGPTMLLEKRERQELIGKSQHFFICDCIACTENWSIDLELDMMIQSFNNPEFKSELQKIEDIQFVFCSVLGKKEDRIYSKSILNKVVKIMKAISKTLPAYVAFKHNFWYGAWMSMYFEKKFGIEVSEIPSDC